MEITPYQFTNTENFSMSLYVGGSGKSVRNEAFSTYFPKHTYYTLHFVAEGEAEYIKKDEKHKITKNDLVVVFPDQHCELKVTKPPYINYWLNISGSDFLHFITYTNITISNPVFKMKENISDLFEKLHSIQGPEPYQQTEMLSVIYSILSSVIKESNQVRKTDNKRYYILRFVDCVENNYGSNIQISDIAKYVGISTSQLYRVVYEEFGMSPVKFLIKHRIKMSKFFLENRNNFKISTIANLCGFSDPLYFSRVFYKYNKISPSEYKKSRLQD